MTKQLVQDCVIRLLILIACRQVPVVLNILQRRVQCFNIVFSNITQTKFSGSKVVLLLHLVNLCTNVSNLNIDKTVLHSVNLSLEFLIQVLEIILVSNTSLTLIVVISQCYLSIVVKFNLSESICSRILHVERIELAEVLVSISQYCICSLKVLGNLTISLIVSCDILRSLNCISVNIRMVSQNCTNVSSTVTIDSRYSCKSRNNLLILIDSTCLQSIEICQELVGINFWQLTDLHLFILIYLSNSSNQRSLFCNTCSNDIIIVHLVNVSLSQIA